MADRAAYQAAHEPLIERFEAFWVRVRKPVSSVRADMILEKRGIERSVVELVADLSCWVVMAVQKPWMKGGTGEF